MKVFELLPRPLGNIFRKLTHLPCNSRQSVWRSMRKARFALKPLRQTLRPLRPLRLPLTHSKLPQTLCLRASPLLGHRLRRLLPAVVGGYVLKQQFHGSDFNTETQRLRVFWETYFATFAFFAATPTSKL